MGAVFSCRYFVTQESNRCLHYLKALVCKELREKTRKPHKNGTLHSAASVNTVGYLFYFCSSFPSLVMELLCLYFDRTVDEENIFSGYCFYVK